MPVAIDIDIGFNELQNLFKLLNKLEELANLSETQISRLMNRLMPTIRESVQAEYDVKRKNLGASKRYLEDKARRFKNRNKVVVRDGVKRRVLHARKKGFRTETLFRSLRNERGTDVGLIFDVKKEARQTLGRIFLNPRVFTKRNFNWAQKINQQIGFTDLTSSRNTAVSDTIIRLIEELIAQEVAASF